MKESLKVLYEFPDIFRAQRIQVGPDFTVEFRSEAYQWEVMRLGGFVSRHDYLDQAIDAIMALDENVTLPQDLSIVE